MGKLALTRIDARLIHGQIASKWSKVLNISKIIIVDDETAHDDFMKQFFEMAGVPGVKTLIYGVEEGAKRWIEDSFGDGNIIVIFKDVDSAQRAYNAGFDYPSLDIGQVPGGTLDRVNIIGSVNLNSEEIKKLRELKISGVDVYFQSLPEPEDKPHELDMVLNKLKL